jgi:predicted GNAT family N-acyltransferase
VNILPYKREYHRDHFSCGKPTLDNYILRNASKDVQSGARTCFVVLDDQQRVIAYYTLSTDSIPLDDAPEDLKKKIKYPHIPVILLGRLAVHIEYGGKGYGKLLLVDALKRSLQVAKEHIGSVAVIVDPIDTDAEQFYKKYGFIKIPDSGRMFMTMKKIQEAFEKSA